MKPASGKNSTLQKHGPAVVSLCTVLLVVLMLVADHCSTYWKRSSQVAVINPGPVPAEYTEPCAHPGTVVRIDYPARDYLAGANITKPAFVYLPYGYDEASDQEYDVLYFMHGWMMQAQDLYADEFHIKELFDHLIENGDTRPFIAVGLTFDAENRAQSYERSVEELALFHYELRQYAVPYLEKQLSTCADDTSPLGLRRSRSHRAFAGFSMGAVTCWHQFIFNLDFIRSFIPVSADSWIKGSNGGMVRTDATVNELVKAIHRNGLGLKDYFIYAGIGTIDPMYTQMDTQVQEMMKRQEFAAENMVYGIMENGYHNMEEMRVHLYHALPLIYPGQ